VRRLDEPEAKPVRRFVGPLVLACVVAGLLVVVLFPRPAPPVPETEVAATPPAAATAIADAEGVPIQATEAPQAPSAPTPDPQVVNEQRLREAVFAPFRGVDGRFGIVVKDLSTGRSIKLNENYPFQAASLYKLPVMYEVFKQRDLNMFSLSEEMTIGADDVAMDLGSLPWPAGTRITIGTALDRMVTLSDNSGAFMLAKKVGTPHINEDMLSLGLPSTHVRGDDLQTSAADMARLLEMIARGEALSTETSAEMVHLMARQQVRNRIPVKMPPEAVVANKTGNWEAAAHDVAIVYGPRATFVIALLSDGITDIDALYDAMATSARNVYDVLNDPAFGSSASPALPKSQVASYQSPVRLPGAAAASSGSGSSASATSSSAGASQTRSASSGSGAAVAPTSAPVDRPRPTQPSAPAPPKPASSGQTLPPASGPGASVPAPKPADKPAEKPAAPAANPVANPGAPPANPAVKPQMPSIFTIPAPTKTP
jgi:beta-lactamase class A